MHIPFFTSGVKAITEFFAEVISYLRLFTASDMDFKSLSVCWVYNPCFTKLSFNQRLKFLWEALGPQIREYKSKGPAAKDSPKANLSMYAVEGGNNCRSLQQIVKQYWVAQKPKNVILGVVGAEVTCVTFKISIRASNKRGYRSLSGVPRTKLQANPSSLGTSWLLISTFVIM